MCARHKASVDNDFQHTSRYAVQRYANKRTRNCGIAVFLAPLSGRELRALRRLKREQDPSLSIFTSERGAPFTPAGFRKMVARLGVAANLGFPVHPHMLRHACGFKLANDGVDTRSLQAYLGHRNIQHTVRYTELAPTRFKNFWHD